MALKFTKTESKISPLVIVELNQGETVTHHLNTQ